MDLNNRPPFRPYGNPTNRGYPPLRPRFQGPGQFQGQHYHQQQYPYNPQYPQSFNQPGGQFPHPPDLRHQHPQPHQQLLWQFSLQRHHQQERQQQQQGPNDRHESRRQPHDKQPPRPHPQQHQRQQQQQPRHQQETRRSAPKSHRGIGFLQRQARDVGLPSPQRSLPRLSQEETGIQSSGSLSQSGVSSGSRNQPTSTGTSTVGVNPQSSSDGSSSQPAGSSTTENTPRSDGSSHATESGQDAEKSGSPTGLPHKGDTADKCGLMQHSEQEDLDAESGPSEEKKESASDSDPRCVETARSTEDDSTSEQQHAGVVTSGAQCDGIKGRVLDTQDEGHVKDTQGNRPEEETEGADAKNQKSSLKQKKSGKGQGQEGRAAGGANEKGRTARSEKKQLQFQQRARELYDREVMPKTWEMLGNDSSRPKAHFHPPFHFNRSAASCNQGKVKDTSRLPNLTSDIASDRAERTVEQCMKVIANTTTGLELTALYNYSFDDYLTKPLAEARKKHEELFQDETIVSAPPTKARSKKSPTSYGACDDRGANETAYSVCCEEGSTAATVAGSDSVSGGLSLPTASCEVASEQVSLQARNSPTDLVTEEGEQPVTSGETITTASSKKKNRGNKKKKEHEDKGSVHPATQLCPEKGEKEPSANDATDADSRQPGNPTEKSDSSPASSQAAPQRTKPKPRGGKLPQPRSVYPSPEQLEQPEMNRGDIDMLLLYQGKGCVVMEIKAVGYNKSDPATDNSCCSDQPGDGEYEVVRKKIYLALQQLTKVENFLRHVFSDLADELPVMKTIGLPNLTRGYVLDACSEDETLQQELCRCLCARTTEEALTKVLCSDDIDPSLKSPCYAVAGKEPSYDALLRWWQKVITQDNSGEETDQEETNVVTCSGQGLSKDMYRKIVERLAGPLSYVTVESCRGAAEARTVGDCVHLTGLRFGRSLLHGDQQRILESKEPFVYISGPPGSGKTLVLGFKGVEWARQGGHVVVFVPQGTGWGRLISLTLYQRIKEHASRPAPSSGQPQGKRAKESDSQFSMMPPCRHASEDPRPVSVHVATINKTEDPKKFVHDLLERFSDGRLLFLFDEGPNKRGEEYLHGPLAQSTRQMKESAEVLNRLVLEMENSGESGSTRDTQCECVNKHEKTKTLVEMVRHHLHIIGERLEIFQPPHGRPLQTQTETWKTMVTDIAASRQLILGLLARLEATSLSLKPDDEKSSKEPSETFSEQILEGKDASQPADTNPSRKEGDGPEGQPETRTKDDLNAADAPTSASRVLAALDKLEGEMLDASGWMFNVETQLDFLVIQDVLSLLVQEKGKRDVSVWSTGVMESRKPENFTYKTLTHCLRCPPKIQEVLRLVEKGMEECFEYSYILDSLQYVRLPLPTDGPEVELLDHSSHLNEARDILDCRQCGDNLANYLVDTLRVGYIRNGLQPDDVIISGSLDICSVRGRPLIKALEDKGIQLQFEQQGLTSPPPYPAKVFVVGGCALQGLESKIVVVIPDVSRIPSDTGNVEQFPPTGLPAWLKNLGLWNRNHLWFVASRCLAKLIVFHV